MKPITLLVMAALAVLAGCSSTETKVNEGPIRGSSFTFVAATAPLPGYADKREPIHQMIHEAIAKNLTGRGLKRADSGGDIIVAYLVIVGNNASTEMIDKYFGYGGDAPDLHEKAHAAYTGDQGSQFYQAGTLLIDLVDAQSGKLLKRGSATGSRLRNLPPDAQAAKIQETVDDILKDVQVAP
jgi:hypothetical protein